MLLADEPADGARLVAETAVAVVHGAGRRAVNAELRLKPGADDVVPRADRAVLADEEFRHEKKRYPLRPRRRVGEPGEHEVDDVLGNIMLAVGDEYLLPEEAVGSIAARLCPRRERTEVGPRLRLRQVHGRGPCRRR